MGPRLPMMYPLQSSSQRIGGVTRAVDEEIKFFQSKKQLQTKTVVKDE